MANRFWPMQEVLADDEFDDESADSVNPYCDKRRIYMGAGGACAVFILIEIVVMLISRSALIGVDPSFTNDASLVPTESARHLGWSGCPMGYKDNAALDKCGGICFNAKLIQDMETFNRLHGFKEVSFFSRAGPDGQEVVNLTAWWLPAPKYSATDPRPAPRIVVQHGKSSNFNDCAAQFGAYQLRTLGFGVLVPNLRNHGTSGRTANAGAITWGWEYQYDLLGAWDYAVLDPDGLLDGSLSPDQVGIQGYSMGGFIGPVAFGLETRIPGAWFDSGVADLYDMYGEILQYYLRFAFLESIVQVFQLPGWYFTKWTAGVDIEYLTPTKALGSSCASRSRPVAVSASQFDVLVPYEQSRKLVNLLDAVGSGACYDVTQVYFPKASCNANAHVISEMTYAPIYKEKLCTFWNHVFNRNSSYCRSAHAYKLEAGEDLPLMQMLSLIRVAVFLAYLALAIVLFWYILQRRR
eukprot:TRINITY_DN47800_c0_g1_i1.p1 TRINITY_DN47800_c0_g1~~TRINITY_DN47800_c0_g1_i1.p1  ORF type:complete len:490 (-),score=36.40 TRINITY_DN47800_c0_g1_i1:71-1468(-)